MPADPSVVVLDAEMLGHFNTDDGRSKRWVEMTLVGTDNGYLVYGVGRSRAPGEIDRPWGKYYPEAFLVVRSLLTPPAGRQENTTAHARVMLDGCDDEGIREAILRWRG